MISRHEIIILNNLRMLPAPEIWEGAHQPPLIIGFRVTEGRDDTCSYIRNCVWGIIELAILMFMINRDKIMILNNLRMLPAPEIWKGAHQPPLIIGFHVSEGREDTCS